MPLILIALSICILYMASLAKKRNFFYDFHSLKQTQSWKGIAAIAIVLDHIWFSTNSIWLKPFYLSAFLVVGLFFYLSGYGLIKSQPKETSVFQITMVRRLLSIIIPVLIANALFVCTLIIAGSTYTLPEALFSIVNIFGGDRINSAVWFIFNLVFLYVLYFISFRLFNKETAVLCLLGMTCVMTALFVIFTPNQYNLFGMNFCFVVGIIVGYFEHRIFAFIKKKPIKSVLISLGFFLLFLLLYQYFYENIVIGKVIFRNLSAIWFSLFVVIFGLLIKLQNKSTLFWGKISFELFLYHNLFITLFRSNIFYIPDDSIYTVSVLIATFICSFLINKLDVKINGVIRKKFA